MFLQFNNSAGGTELPVVFNTDIITDISGVSIEPYKKNTVPMMSMQHNVIVSDSRQEQSHTTTTLRLKTIYRSMGFMELMLQNICPLCVVFKLSIMMFIV